MNNPPHHPQVDAEQPLGQSTLSPNIELPHIKTPSRNSFDDSLDAHHELGQKSPGKVIAFIQYSPFYYNSEYCLVRIKMKR